MSQKIVATYTGEDEDGVYYCYDLQQIIGEAVNAAMGADGSASHWVWVKVGGQLCAISSIEVVRDGEDDAQIIIHAAPHED